MTTSNTVSNVSNNTKTFKPYNPGEIVGDTSPEVPIPPPPPQPKKNNCGVIGQILIAVVVIVVTVYTGGLAAGALGLASGTLSAAVVGGAIGAAAGSIVGQGMGMAMGYQDEFSWNAVGTAAIGGAIGGGLSHAFSQAGTLQNLNNASYGTLQAVTANVLNQGAMILVGQQDHFNWKSVGMAAVTAPINNYANEKIGNANIGTRFLNETTQSLVNQKAQQLFYGGRFEWKQVATDAFGNTLGNKYVDAVVKPYVDETVARWELEREAKRQEVTAQGKWNVVADDPSLESMFGGVELRYPAVEEVSGGYLAFTSLSGRDSGSQVETYPYKRDPIEIYPYDGGPDFNNGFFNEDLIKRTATREGMNSGQQSLSLSGLQLAANTGAEACIASCHGNNYQPGQMMSDTDQEGWAAFIGILSPTPFGKVKAVEKAAEVAGDFFTVAKGAKLTGVTTSSDGIATWVRVANDPKAVVRIESGFSGQSVTDVYKGSLPSGSGSQLLAIGLDATGLKSGGQFSFTGIINPETLSAYQSGVAASNSLLGKVGTNALSSMGLEASTIEYQVVRGKLNIVIGVK